jgi:hypothetical protein
MKIVSLVELRLSSEGIIIPPNTILTFKDSEVILTSLDKIVPIKNDCVSQDIQKAIEAKDNGCKNSVEKSCSIENSTKDSSQGIKERIVYNYPTIENAYDCELNNIEKDNFFESLDNYKPDENITSRDICKGTINRIRKRDTSMTRKIKKEQNDRLSMNVPKRIEEVNPDIASCIPYDQPQQEEENHFEKIDFLTSFDQLIDLREGSDYTVSI